VQRSVTQPLDQGKPPSSPSGKSTGSGSSDGSEPRGPGKAVCRWGRKCHRSDCWFEHPEGRDLDDGKGDKSDAQSTHSDPADCECCGGDPFNCQTPACVEQGMCGCTYGLEQDVEEADAWKDEWFPASKDCKCCGGYVYKCKTTEPACESGECFCLLVTGASQTGSPKNQGADHKADSGAARPGQPAASPTGSATPGQQPAAAAGANAAAPAGNAAVAPAAAAAAPKKADTPAKAS